MTGSAAPRIRTQPAVLRPPRSLATVIAVALALAVAGFGTARAWQETDSRIDVIAGGVAAVPDGEVVWRTVRAQADQAATAPFRTSQLGFVIATTGPLLLADTTLTHLTRLLPGEAVFVPPGVVQQRSSLGDTPVNYLAIELVPAAEAATAEGGTVLQPGQPFPSPGGFRDFDLISGAVTSADTYALPETGQTNFLLVTDGTVSVSRDGTPLTTLIAGESATYSSSLDVAGADPETPSVFVVATLGDEVTPPAAPAGEPTTTDTPVAETPVAEATVSVAEGSGSITVQALLCPPGMTEETLIPDQCEPTTSEFVATLAGDALPAPLVLADATEENGTYRWSDLPFGDYRLAEAVLPESYETYILRGARATGDATTGYTVTLSAETPDLSIQFYNFVSQ